MTETPTRRSATDYLALALGEQTTTTGHRTEMLEPELQELLSRYGSAAVHNTLRALDPCHGYPDFTGAGALPQARETDPGTSHAAAADPRRRMRAAGQVAELLLAFADDPDEGTPEEGYTAEQVCDYVVSLTFGDTRPSWRRVSDLRRLGLVAPTGESRTSPTTGLDAEVLTITKRGTEVADEILTARAGGRKSIRLDVKGA